MDTLKLRFIVDESNGDQLIVPDFGVGSRGWNKDNKWCRSLHVDKNGRPISVGLPKFLNLSEGNEQNGLRVDVYDLLKANDLVATLKLDGSLIIRYVRDNQVCFRTRGSLGVGLECWEYDLVDFKKRYPKLFDPNILPDQSFLMEYISPDNQIVLKYDSPDLVAIGCVSFDKDRRWEDSNFKLRNIHDVELIAMEFGLSVVEYFSIETPQQCQTFIDDIVKNKDIEGFVVRFDSDQRLVKIKSSQYVKLHALKSNLDTLHMIDVWLESGRKDFKHFRDYFEGLYDFETFQYALPVISSMFDGIHETNKQIDHVTNFVLFNKNLPRKEFAILSQQRFNDLNLAMCFSLLDDKGIDDKMMKKLIAQKTKYVSRSMFDE